MPDDQRDPNAPAAEFSQPDWQNAAVTTPQQSPQPQLRIEEQPEIPQFQQLHQNYAQSERAQPEQYSSESQYDPQFDVQQGFDPNQQVPEEQGYAQEYEQQAYEQQPQMYSPQYAAMPVQPEPEYLLMEWIADSRVTWRRSKEYYSSLAVIVLLISLILFFAGQTLLIFVVLAFLFISYVLSTVRAESIPHQFTTYGLRYRGEKLIYWSEMVRFWIKDNHGITEVHIEAPGELMNELILLPANAQSPIAVTADDLVDLLSRYLPFQEPLPSQLDRWVTWVQEKFPLE